MTSGLVHAFGQRLRIAARFGVAALVIVTACGCAHLTLPRTVTADELATQRVAFVRETETLQEALAEKLAKRLVHKAAVDGTDAPTLDFLILSGGGQHGAFGAGFLSGWGDVQHPDWARPEFDVVTGVSTGALIAPFALAGDDDAYARVDDIYRQVTKELAVLRGMLFFLPWKPSLYDNFRLDAMLKEELDGELMSVLMRGNEEHRALLIGATDLDLGLLSVWDLTQEARTHPEPAERVREILMASSAIPAVFPPVVIGDRVYVDGGASQMLVLGANAEVFANLVEHVRAIAPELVEYRVRLWFVVNAKLFPQPHPVPMRWGSLARRSLDTLTRASTLTHLRRIHYLTQLLPQEYPELAFEFRYVAIPQQIDIPETRQLFDAQVTHLLSELGRDMGRAPSVWRTVVPDLQP